jgi:hypothetical protein
VIADWLMSNRLAVMFAMQQEFQTRASSTEGLYDVPPGGTTTYEVDRINEFRTMVLALEDELHEALNETGWKPWASSRHFNTDAVKGELVDAWCFLMSLMLLAGMTPAELYQRYQAKMEINHKRQDEGYSGTEKCKECGRALDDPATACYDDGDDAWCMANASYGDAR